MGLVGGRRLGSEDTMALGGATRKQVLALPDEPGMPGKLRWMATRGVSESDRASCAGLTTPIRFLNGTPFIPRGARFDGSRPTQHQLLGCPGLGRPSVVFEPRCGDPGHPEERPPYRFNKDGEGSNGLSSESSMAWERGALPGAHDNLLAAETGERHLSWSPGRATARSWVLKIA